MENLTMYRVVFDCPDPGCGRRCPTGFLMRFPDPTLDGRPLSDAYPPERDIAEEIKAFDPNLIRCLGKIVTPRPDQFFLELS
jgi:hypothetical protein